MSKRKKNNHDDEDDTTRYVYVGDYNSFNNSNNNNNKYQYHDLQKKIDVLSTRLNYIEASLAPANILKATPITSLVMGDTKCLYRIRDIYSKWINYISHLAHSNNNNNNTLTVEKVFNLLDQYIFEGYFQNLKKQYLIEFVKINYYDDGDDYSSEQIRILKQALEKDRSYNFKLLYPENNEHVSVLVENNRIFLVYFFQELQEIVKLETTTTSTTTTTPTNSEDFQFYYYGKLHPILSLNKDIIGNPDINSIKIFNNEKDNSLNISSNFIKDKRHNILGSRRTLYNTLIDIDSLNKFNSKLYNFNQILLNLSLIVYHAMLHIKCDVSSSSLQSTTTTTTPTPAAHREHDSLFMKQFLNYTPSVLFGHPLIPQFTLPK